MEVDSLRSSVQTEEAAVYCMLYLSLSQISPVAPCAVLSARKQKTNGGFMQYPTQLAVCPGWKRHQGATILLGGVREATSLNTIKWWSQDTIFSCPAQGSWFISAHLANNEVSISICARHSLHSNNLLTLLTGPAARPADKARAPNSPKANPRLSCRLQLQHPLANITNFCEIHPTAWRSRRTFLFSVKKLLSPPFHPQEVATAFAADGRLGNSSVGLSGEMRSEQDQATFLK